MLTSVWNGREKIILWILVGLWFVSVVIFFNWWFDDNHVVNIGGFYLTTIILIWSVSLPGYSFYFLLNMTKLKANNSHNRFKVAVVITKAPSEPFSVLVRTLEGVLRMKGKFDIWVADEDPSIQSLDWYHEKGIFVSTRKNDPNYHNEKYPRRKKCKEGNLAYFYDKYGYENYDIVIQLDVDHVPDVDYLEKVVAPFSNPSIGYVGAPSVCDANSDLSWSARARVQSEAMFHGPIQSGANLVGAPVCIGSHYAVRTQALKSIGGLGPELAEDFSTTMLLNAKGWKGCWVNDANARGDGPLSLADLIVQDYQWSRSLIILLMTLYWRLFLRLGNRERWQFLFAQLWYPISAFVWLISVLLPLVSIALGMPIVSVNFVTFMVYFMIQWLISIVIFGFVRNRGYLRPVNVKLFSWENALFELARWPWVCVAVIDGVSSVIFKRVVNFRVTPKGDMSVNKLPFSIQVPYFIILMLSLVVILFGSINEDNYGYYLFSMMVFYAYLWLILGSVLLHVREVGDSLRNLFRHYRYFLITIWFWIISVPVFGYNGFSVNGQILQNSLFVSYSQTQVLGDSTVDLPSIQEQETLQYEVANLVEDRSLNHIVQPGESLWKISEVYYGDGNLWNQIESSSGSKILPGQIVKVPFVDTEVNTD